jgi:hypothetical protein
VIAAIIAKILTGGLLDKITGLADSYLKGQVTKAEFEARVRIEAGKAGVEIEQAWLKAAAEQYESLQKTLRGSVVLQRAYAVVMISQLAVLVFYQIGASAFKLATGTDWPVPQATIEWAYLLLGITLGGGLIVQRSQRDR